MNEEGFRSAYLKYMRYISSNDQRVEQRTADALLDGAEQFVPHARLDELHSFDEIPRDTEEVITEAIKRETMYEETNALELLLYVRDQQVAALSHDSDRDRYKVNARNNIGRIDRDIARLKGALNS